MRPSLCAGCSAPLVHTPGAKPRKWCSNPCRAASYRTPRPGYQPNACRGCRGPIRTRLARNSVYCSEPCRQAGVVRPKECRVCGQAFSDSRGKPRKTCSDQCSDEAKRVARSKRRSTKGSIRKPRPTCEVCGVAYKRTYPAQRTCGRECGGVLSARNRDVPFMTIPSPPVAVATLVTCPECSAPFIRLRFEPRRACCTTVCAALRARRRDLRRYGKTPEDVDTCARCGKTKARGSRKYCDVCRPLAARDEIRNTRRRRRARKRAAAHEPYTLEEIAARDRYRCGLCLKPVPMDRVVPDFEAPTIDHLLPLCDGGDDVRANVHLAHFICNSRRGAGGTVQLALVG